MSKVAEDQEADTKKVDVVRRRSKRPLLIALALVVGIILALVACKLLIPKLSQSNNTANEEPKVEIVDEIAPVVKLNGNEIVVVKLGDKYEEAGVTASDNYDDELTMESVGDVDTAAVGTYTITYKATDAAGNVGEAKRTVYVTDSKAGEKIVYLTFDDGPSEYTAELLDVLKKYGVKATFFVTGAGSDDMLRREYDEGHAIGLHTFSHNYAYVYQSVGNFFADLYKVQERVKNATGYTSYLMRFPGGSSNTVSIRHDGGTRIMSTLINEVGRRGFTYFDWNVSSGDAGGASTPEQVYNNVVQALKPESSVVLQHDTKGFSVAAVEQIIQYGLENGFSFAKLDETAFTAHHGVNN